MKKFFWLFFVVGHFNLFAQDCDLPVPYSSGSTGDNMTLLLTDSFFLSLSDLALPASDNPYIVAINTKDIVVGSSSVKANDLDNGQQSIAVWGDDMYTTDIDGAIGGEAISLKLVDGNYLFSLASGVNMSYQSNNFFPIGYVAVDFDCDGAIKGCTGFSACNFDALATEDDGSCIYPQQYSDCNGQCLNDTDGDGICDELEIVGCTEPMACNYEPTATDEGSCEYFGIDSCNVSVMEVNRSDFKLYPNPGNDRINIQSAHKQERLEISMTNILGANLLYRSLNNVHPSDLIEVHLPALPSGVYTVTFSSSSAKSSIRWIKK